MAEQLQVALGLRDAVKRWCLFPAPSKGLTGPSSNLTNPERYLPVGGFLDQLLLVGALKEAGAAPLPTHLFPEEAAGHQDSEGFGSPLSPVQTPSSRSRCSTFRSDFDSHSAPVSALQEGPFPLRHPQERAEQTASVAADAQPSIESQRSLATPRKGQTRCASLQSEPQLRTEGREASSATLKALLVPPKTHLPSSCAEQTQEPAGDATKADENFTSADQQKCRQHQQRPSHTAKQPKSAAAKLNTDKGTKRRSESHGALRGMYSEATGTPAPAVTRGPAPSLQLTRDSVVRAEGPPQKRQAVGRRRGEAAALIRSSSVNSGGLKGAAAGVQKTASATRGASAGVLHSTGCRINTTAKLSHVKSKQPSQVQTQERQQQQQQLEGSLSSPACQSLPFMESSGDIEVDSATKSAAAAAALAAARCSSAQDSSQDPLSAFAAEWLLGCQQRLLAASGEAPERPANSSSGDRIPEAARPVPIAGGCPGRQGDLHKLQITKKRLKQELRAYNTAFASYFGRQPLKQDKEPLRPLYMHYQRIKQCIEHLMAAEGNGHTAVESDTPNAVDAAASQTATASAATSTRRKSPSASSSPTTNSPTCAMKRLRKSRSLRLADGLSPKAAQRLGNSGGGHRSPVIANEKSWSKLSAYDRQQLLQQKREEMTFQLHQLKRERRLLGDKLAAYHLRFKQEHGRPLRLKADITPVQEEYKLYVETTRQLDALAFALQNQPL